MGLLSGTEGDYKKNKVILAGFRKRGRGEEGAGAGARGENPF